MDTDHLQLGLDGRVLVMTINNPSTRNSVGREFFLAASKALGAAASDAGVGAVVLTGADGFFSSGGNLRQLAANRDLEPGVRRARLDLLNRLVLDLRRSPQPVITAVEGGAVGAGMALALAGDLLVAADDAFFAASQVTAGLTPDGGLTSLLAESLPRQALTQACLTGERLGARRLHAWGAATALCAPGTAATEAIELGHQLAAGPPRATQRILQLCRTAHLLPVEEQMDREAEAMVTSQGDPEAAEGIAAVRERRPARFETVRRARGSGGVEGRDPGDLPS